MVLGACNKAESNMLIVPSGSIIVPEAGMQGSTTFDSRNITSIKAISTPMGWSVDNIDMYEGVITVTAPASFDNDESRRGTLSLRGYTPTGDTRTIDIYLAIAETKSFDNAANCFVASIPMTRYTFNPFKGGTEDIVLETANIKLLWQTRSNLIRFLHIRENESGELEASFYVDEDKDDEGNSKVYPGNALIGAYNAAGEVIWSWHVWVTNCDIEATAVELNGKTMMSVNLGAELNSNGSTDAEEIYSSYGMYYQWGRKEPFVGPQAYNFPGNNDCVLYSERGWGDINIEYVDSTAEHGTVEWAVANPLALIKGYKDNDYNWLYDKDDELWNGSTKSEYDPCPAGWRVPDSSLFANLTIAALDDELAWSEAQKQYGFNLVNTETEREYFFTAQGRRNYIDCRLDIFNDNETLPVPWSGYYWTSTVDNSDAKALYFDLNTVTRTTWNDIDVSRSMRRANALPIRCVKDK